MWSTDDIIAAIASPATSGLRSIVRLSGQNVAECVDELFSCEDDWRLSRRARRWNGTVDLGAPLKRVPCELMFWPTHRSYTRQPAAELHLPGSIPIAEACLQRFCERGKARLAQPGEFTLRAYLAGRIDLTQAEAVLGVIDAQSADELAIALRQLSGNLAQPLANARAQLLSALSHLEAGLDFADEDIEFISDDELRRSLAAAADSVETTIGQIEGRGQSDGVPRVVIYGRPNSGKSSLFNCLCDANAIVSPTAGTTRDYLIANAAIDGVEFELVDTAGLDPQLHHDVDQQSQALGQEQIEQASVRVLCVDCSTSLSSWEAEQLTLSDPQRLVVGSKADCASSDGASLDGPGASGAELVARAEAVSCSSVTGEGLANVKAAIVARLARECVTDVVPCTAVRSRDSLHRTRQALRQAVELVDAGDGEELVAIELRAALDHLGDVAGRLHHEEVLDQVFRQFCIGK